MNFFEYYILYKKNVAIGVICESCHYYIQNDPIHLHIPLHDDANQNIHVVSRVKDPCSKCVICWLSKRIEFIFFLFYPDNVTTDIEGILTFEMKQYTLHCP